MKFLYFIIQLLVSCNSNRIFKKFIRSDESIYRIDTYINKPLSKDPIFLTGYYTPYKKEVCKSIAEINNMPFIEYKYEYFMNELPMHRYNNTLIYVNGFTFRNRKELKPLIFLYKTCNSVIFEFNLCKTILDYETIKFPEIKNEDIVNYIYDMIIYHRYNRNMILLNWLAYDIFHLDTKRINTLLEKINDEFNKDNIYIEKAHKHMNSIVANI